LEFVLGRAPSGRAIRYKSSPDKEKTTPRSSSCFSNRDAGFSLLSLTLRGNFHILGNLYWLFVVLKYFYNTKKTYLFFSFFADYFFNLPYKN
jgi:hypothetical protein